MHGGPAAVAAVLPVSTAPVSPRRLPRPAPWCYLPEEALPSALLREE